MDSIKLQASSLTKFTQATNQLTRNTLVIVLVFYVFEKSKNLYNK